jgi:flagellar biosynthetic protein FliQ
VTPEQVGTLLEHAILAVLALSAPALLAGLAVGLVVSIIQAATQIQEVTLVFIPKMLVVGLVLWMVGPWINDRLFLFINEVMDSFRRVATGGF